jgi:hypothetical protein
MKEVFAPAPRLLVPIALNVNENFAYWDAISEVFTMPREIFRPGDIPIQLKFIAPFLLDNSRVIYYKDCLKIASEPRRFGIIFNGGDTAADRIDLGEE